jgi:hypothetical protein
MMKADFDRNSRLAQRARRVKIRWAGLEFNLCELILYIRRVYIGEFRYRDVIFPDGITVIVPKVCLTSAGEMAKK